MTVFKIIILTVFPLLISAQTFNVSGKITDENGEPLIGATVFDSLTQKGVEVNNYGFYSIYLSNNSRVLTYSFVGCQKKTVVLDNHKDTVIIVQLKPSELTEIVVRDQKSIENTKISSITLPIEQIKKIPAIGGETDIIKALGLTPGVSNGTEGSAGLFVRGGTPDQNLILLDEATVYNPNHLFGLLSVFNPDAVKNVELIKGGFPARYGGRLSSILDITMKEGSLNKKKTEFGIGVVASRLTLERPIIKNKMSLLLSARTSYLGLIFLPQYFKYKSGQATEYFNYFLYDLNIKLSYKIGEKNQIYLSLYTGNDELASFDNIRIYSEEKKYIDWGNVTATLRYNKNISKNIFWKNSLIYSKFGFKSRTINSSDSANRSSQYENFSGLTDFTVKSAIDIIPNNQHYIKAGSEVIIHDFTPQIKQFNTNDSLIKSFTKTEKLVAFEPSLFIEDLWSVSNRLKINMGIRFNNYRIPDKNYISIEPRLTFLFDVYNNWIIKAAYSKMQQNIHLLTNSGIGYQNDVWVPSTLSVKPQKSEQYAFGISKYFSHWDLNFSFEGYYKKMNDLIDFKEGANFVFDLNDWEKSVEVSGDGESRGLEFFLHKKTGHLNGFLSYTLSKTTRQFKNINSGESYPFRYDARHSIALTFNYQISRKWDISTTWQYKSGEAITLPLYSIQGAFIENYNLPTTYFIYSKRNGYRLPDYHRLDIAANRTTISKKGRKHVLSIGIYNVYDRKNTSYLVVANERISFDPKTGASQFKQSLQQKALFPIIPSVSYALSF
jgi:outer membrane receptor for ferrienterochelin and colicin